MAVLDPITYPRHNETKEKVLCHENVWDRLWDNTWGKQMQKQKCAELCYCVELVFTYVNVWTLTETRNFVPDGYVCSTR